MRLRILLIFIIFIGAGCAHLRDNSGTSPMSPDAPELQSVLDGLATTGQPIRNLESNGMITMRLPGEAGNQRFQGGHIRYHAPDSFFAEGRKVGYVVRIYVDGPRFLLELTSEKVFYTGEEGDVFEDIALDLAPSRVFRELFLIDVLGEIDPARVQMESYDATTQQVTLAVNGAGRKHARERRVVAERQPDDGWRVIQSIVYDARGELMGETTCERYETVNGAVLPAKVTAVFPQHDAKMSFDLRTETAKVNLENPRVIEAIDAKRGELIEKGFREVRGVAKETGVR